MNIDVSTLWLLCTATTTVCAAAAARNWRRLLVMGVACALTLAVLGPSGVPSAGVCGATAAAAAGACLVAGESAIRLRDRLSLVVSAATAGALIAVSGSLLDRQGVPSIAAYALAAALPLVSGWLAARHPDFAPRAVLEDALLSLAALGLLVAVIPTLADGWRSAVALNVHLPAAAGSERQMLPGWTVAITIGALLTGGLFARRSAWRRR